MIIKRCSEQSCELKLDNLNDYVILKGEKLCQQYKICDCIIFTSDNDNIIGIVELKSRTIHAHDIEDKFNNGMEKVIKILEECDVNSKNFEFYFIVLSKKWSNSEYVMCKNIKIKIRGKKFSVIPKKCGDSFSAIIANLR